MRGGGRGAIFYNSATAGDCEEFLGTLIVSDCTNNGGLAFSVTRRQGQIFRDALTSSTSVITATLVTNPARALPLEFLSGTSMAAPHAAGEPNFY